MKTRSDPLDKSILQVFRSARGGRVLSLRHFEHLGSPAAVRQTLSRLVKAGTIRRVTRGIYDLPRQHPIIGQTAPDITSTVRTLMREGRAQWQFSGAYAANALGLSEQVPSKIVILTNAVSRRVLLGKLTLSFRHASPRNLLGAGRTSGLVIQALRYLGKGEITPRRVDHLGRNLDARTKMDLQFLQPKLPVWMRPMIQQICEA